MKISTQCGGLLKRGFTEKETVKILADAGYDFIDMTFFELREIRQIDLPGYEKEMAELKDYANSLGVAFNQAHATFPTSTPDGKNDDEIFRRIVREMELASILGVKNIVVHPKQHLRYRDHSKELKKINYDFYSSLIPYCEKYKIHIATENMWQTDAQSKKEYSVCAKAAEFAEYVDMIGSPWMVACLDLGHCALVGEDIPNMIKTLGCKRLKAVHMHDVDFYNDLHTLPGVSKLKYDKITDALRSINYDGEFTLEADEFLNGFEKEFLPEVCKFMAKRIRFFADKF